MYFLNYDEKFKPIEYKEEFNKVDNEKAYQDYLLNLLNTENLLKGLKKVLRRLR